MMYNRKYGTVIPEGRETNELRSTIAPAYSLGQFPGHRGGRGNRTEPSSLTELGGQRSESGETKMVEFPGQSTGGEGAS